MYLFSMGDLKFILRCQILVLWFNLINLCWIIIWALLIVCMVSPLYDFCVPLFSEFTVFMCILLPHFMVSVFAIYIYALDLTKFWPKGYILNQIYLLLILKWLFCHLILLQYFTFPIFFIKFKTTGRSCRHVHLPVVAWCGLQFSNVCAQFWNCPLCLCP